MIIDNASMQVRPHNVRLSKTLAFASNFIDGNQLKNNCQ